MNILYLNHNVKGRSTYHRCFALAYELTLLGHNVTLLTNSPENRWKFSQYKEKQVAIVECPDLLWGSLRTGWDPVNIIRRCLYLKDKKYDLIHAFDTRPTVILPAFFYKKLVKNVPLFIDWSDWWGKGGAITLRPNKILNILFSPIETFFEEYFRKFANYSTVASRLLMKRIISLGIKPDAATIIPNVSDIRTIYPIDKKLARTKLELPQKTKICLFPGFVLYDLKMVLSAFLYVHSRNPDTRLFLLGEYPNNLDKPYQSLIEKGVIRIFGNINKKKLNLFLSASDVALLPLENNLTNQARFPMKLGDFLAAGIPFVTNNVGDTGYYVKKYKLGYITDYSAPSMGNKILWILNNQIKTDKYASHVRRFSREKFSWEIITKRLNSIYNKLFQKK